MVQNSRRRLAHLAILSFFTLVVGASVRASAQERQVPDARAGESQATASRVGAGLVDLHVDLSYQHNYHSAAFERGTGQFRADRLAAAKVRGVVLPLFVPANVSAKGPTLAELERSYLNVVGRLSQSRVYLPPLAPPQAGRVQTWLAFEGAAPLADDLDAIPRWVKRGVRVFGLVHTSDNVLAASATGIGASHLGLTALGEQFVTRVHRSGGVIDISHASQQAALDVATIALRDGVPVIATHSNAYALVPHPRNLTDQVILAIARTGGVVGINFHSPFLRKGGKAKLADVVAHVLYVRQLVGVEHVAIGSDFEGGILPARGLERVETIGKLVLALRHAGLSAEHVEAVLGANALRVLGSGGFSRGAGDARRGASEEAPANGIPVP